ncbi:hypothetical protein H2O64_21485 [Kordia sp. YSTF-M3]|uniref:Uncharacterized protein n=1 Tax=Kordia aestuariivivens TaxID=2759037 RepID=A0ABR7QFB1_9FLAO|nr:hypothetical protein [Kordia aestuariivivens]MBC8757257.1 hypothetical protein [Kordia aestuariivivens]
MNLEARKIEFIQEFLKLQSEASISRLEKILRKEKDVSIEPMTQDELNERIDQSEDDFKNNRFKSSSALLAKYE